MVEARRQSGRAKAYSIAGIVCGILILVFTIIRLTVLTPSYNRY